MKRVRNTKPLSLHHLGKPGGAFFGVAVAPLAVQIGDPAMPPGQQEIDLYLGAPVVIDRIIRIIRIARYYPMNSKRNAALP